MTKNSAFVGNARHFNDEIDFAGSEGLVRMKADPPVSPPTRRIGQGLHFLLSVVLVLMCSFPNVKTATRWLGRVVVPPTLCKSYLDDRRVRLRKQRHRCDKGDDPRTDQVTQGADSYLPGWQPKETAS